jgi:hypothetical protein
MSIVSVNEIQDSRAGQFSVQDGRKFTRVFRILSDYAYDGPNMACQAIGISRGDQYLPNGNLLEFDTNAYCTSISAAQEEGDPLGWIVTVEYGPYSTLFAGGGPQQNPLLQAIDVSWSLRDVEQVVDTDLNLNPITNSAGDPYDPPVVEAETHMVTTVVRNEAIANLPLIVQYVGAVNSDLFGIYNPLQVKCLSIQPKSVCHQDVGWYYQLTYEFESLNPYNPNTQQFGWRKVLLNQGVRALSVVTGKPYHVTIKGVPVTEPVLLDTKGYYQVGPTPSFQVFQTRPELPFSAFNFDPAAISGLRSGFGFGYGPP